MRNYIYTSILVLATLGVAVGCTKEKDPYDSQTVKGRPIVPIEVSYLVDGSEISVLNFNHSAARKEVFVQVNNENLSWTLESNRNWCRIAAGDHKGPGSVTLEIDANESLDAREPATLTFVAGEYRGFQMNISQSATAFIISQPYFLSPLEATDLQAIVTVEAGTEWDIESSEWLTVSKGEPLVTEGFETYTLKISTDLNDGDSRYGAVHLSAGLEEENINVYQFGNELTYDDLGNVLLAASDATFSFIAPSYVVAQVVAPDYVQSEITDNGDGTATVTLSFDENLNDCAETRSIDSLIKLANASATEIGLPSMIQDFIPAGGLVTAKGLKAFAAAVAEGESTEAWEKDGVVTVIKDIDMTDVEEWAGVGTENAPFTGKFNGGGNAIKNLSAAAPLFNVCQGATIENVVIDKSCNLYTSSGEMIGGLVNEAIESKIENCTVNGKVEFSSTSTPAYVGGVVAKADETSSIKSCKLNGSVKSSSASASELYLGGIVGSCEGAVTNCETGGTITLASGHNTVYLGGTTGVLAETTVARTNSFLGKIELSGTTYRLYAGGLYGIALTDREFDVASDKSASMGNISLTNYSATTTTRLYIGGYIGRLEDGASISVKGIENQTGMYFDFSVARAAEYLIAGGILGGCEPDHNTELSSSEVSFSGASNSGEISFNYVTTVAVNIRRSCLGGLVGLVDGPASFSDCSNKATLGAAKGGDYNANSNSYTMIMGGIAGQCYGGNMTFDNCTNDAKVATDFYSNRPAGHAVGNYFSSVATGGILGAFNYKPNPQDYTLTVNKCSSNGFLSSMRGFIGGIAAYAYGATFTDCTWNGNTYHLKQDTSGIPSDNLASYKGGILGGGGNVTLNGCTAKGNIEAFRYGSALSADPGGIVGHVMSAIDHANFDGVGVNLYNCAYFGEISVGKHKTAQASCPGGLIGVGTAESVAENCRYGGKVQGIEVTANTVDTYAIGNNLGTATNTQLWSGN
ncbi:MAG: hypothetical protein II465_03600 [Bacteroidales bacterium]|nr:hypothetical protein [Bacteroidales bacterium]